jgi:ribA/ribD-fused uncharacterized protein
MSNNLLAHFVYEGKLMTDDKQTTNKITRFHGEYDFLSNFYPCVITLDNADYSSIEHAFQAAKTHDPDERYEIQISESPAKAKRLGRQVPLRTDWETIKFTLMEDLVRQKFTRHSELGEKLVETGNSELIEGNTWNDRTYGAVWNKKQGKWIGKNHLGLTLIKVRDELKKHTR